MWNSQVGKTAGKKYTGKVAVGYTLDLLNHCVECQTVQMKELKCSLQRCHYTKGKVKNICPLE